MELTALERRILALILAGDDPVLATLRAQLNAATVTSSKYTGVGFFTHFSVPDTVPRISSERVVIHDVFGDFDNGMRAGFLIFVDNGKLSCLEGFDSRGEAWPSEDCQIEPYYMHHDPPSSPGLRRCAARDIEWLRAMCRGEG